MKIGIDFTATLYGRGVSRYTSNLIQALSQHPSTKLQLFGTSFRQRQQLNKTAHTLVPSLPPEHLAVLPYPPNLLGTLWKFKLLPVSKYLPQLDVFHSWDWIQPPDTNFPLVSTIHDVAMLKYPETAHARILKMHQRSWSELKKRHAHIIAVSRATKKDIVDLLQIPPYRVSVVQEALPSETVFAAEQLTEERHANLVQQLELTRPYIFFVGTREPRKNLLRLIQAWQPLAQDIELVIAGAAGWDQTDKPLTGPQPRFLGRVSQEQLVVLYTEAQLFAYPSLYEGFGLPILESFYFGTPVITSEISSMPEVAGNAAELVDPESVESIRKGIETILGEDVQAQQNRLQRMIIRLHMFSWKKVAEETLAVYKKARAEFESR